MASNNKSASSTTGLFHQWSAKHNHYSTIYAQFQKNLYWQRHRKILRNEMCFSNEYVPRNIQSWKSLIDWINRVRRMCVGGKIIFASLSISDDVIFMSKLFHSTSIIYSYNSGSILSTCLCTAFKRANALVLNLNFTNKTMPNFTSKIK